MNIWLVTTGEPIPVGEGCKDRLYRTGYFAHFLAAHGHDVCWWTSTFDHFRKKHWFTDDASVTPIPRLEIRMLHSSGYRKNISIDRLVDHRRLASKFLTNAEASFPPDIICVALPTIELTLAAVKYGKKHSVPVVIDVRDMWPDVFVNAFPRPLKFLAGVATRPFLREVRQACHGATAIIGITEPFVEWGLKRGTRIRCDMDMAFPMGYSSTPPNMDQIKDAEKFWAERGLSSDSDGFVVCFVGTLGRQLDVETLILAARKLKSGHRSFRFVICGTGDKLDYYRKIAENDTSVMLPGWINAAQIRVLMRNSEVGLDPLPNTHDFLATINNKAIEYMSAGLPVISSPDSGVLCALLKNHQCGMSYPHGDSDALADLLVRLYDDRTTLRQMSNNSMRIFKKMFTAEKVYQEMMNHMVKVSQAGRTGYIGMT